MPTMMSCKENNEKLGALLDGELDEPARTELLRHLTECAACRAEETALRRLDGLADAAYRPDPVDDLAWERTWKSIQAAIAERPTGAGAGIYRWAAAAAAVVVLGALGLLVVWRSDAPQPPVDRLAQLREGAARIEMVHAAAGAVPVVTTTEGQTPVVYVYEVGE